MKDKYFCDIISNISIRDNQAIVGNKITGKWVKIPFECYRAIQHAIEMNLPLNNILDNFKLEEDKVYFEKVIKLLESIGLINESYIDDINLFFKNINIVTFSPTNRCNLSCDYCSVESNITEEEFLNTEQLKQVIDNILKIKPKILIISGGEPLLVKNFLEILEYTRERFDGKISLATNAILINKDNIDKIVNLIDSIEISLDGYDEKSCSIVRGKGVFTKVMSVVEELQSREFRKISLSMVVGECNEKDVKEFNKLNHSLGTVPVIRNFVRMGRGNKNHSKYLKSNFEIFYTGPNDYNSSKSLLSNRCKAGNNQISIDYLGDVYPCPNLEYNEFKMFNIFDFNDEIERNIKTRKISIFEEFDHLKPTNMLECKNCEINQFCTPCPSQMYLLKKSNVMFDSNCKQMRSIISPLLWS